MAKNKDIVTNNIKGIERCNREISKNKKIAAEEGKKAGFFGKFGGLTFASGVLVCAKGVLQTVGSTLHEEAVLENGAEPLPEGTVLKSVLVALGGAVITGVGINLLNKAEEHRHNKASAEAGIKFLEGKRADYIGETENIGQRLDNIETRQETIVPISKIEPREGVEIASYFKEKAFDNNTQDETIPAIVTSPKTGGLDLISEGQTFDK